MKQSTVIMHNVRSEAGLTLSEYVVLAFIDDLYESNLPINEKICEMSIRVPPAVVLKVIKDLIDKGFVEPSKYASGYITTDKWKSLFNADENNYIKFLQPIIIGDRKMEWGPTSKKKVTEKLKLLVKKYPIDTIIDGKIRYFCYLRFLDWDRRPVAGEVFLNAESFNSTYWIDTDEFYKAYEHFSKELNSKFPYDLSKAKLSRSVPVIYDGEEPMPDAPEEDYKQLFR